MYLHSTYAVDWYHMYLHHQRDRVCQNVTKTGVQHSARSISIRMYVLDAISNDYTSGWMYWTPGMTQSIS